MIDTPERDTARPARPPDNWDDWADVPLDGDAAGRDPVFLGREIYRRRRVMDAARLLPAFGAVLLMLPLLWARDHGTAAGMIYLFVVWFFLIGAAALIARRLSEPLRKSDADQPAGPDGRE